MYRLWRRTNWDAIHPCALALVLLSKRRLTSPPPPPTRFGKVDCAFPRYDRRLRSAPDYEVDELLCRYSTQAA